MPIPGRSKRLLASALRIGLTGLVCLAMYGVPAQAQYQNNYNNNNYRNNNYNNNWYHMHQQWSSRCYSQRNQQGHWARDQRYEGWCASNQRFHGQQPDSQWRRVNPHDYGHQNDNTGDHH
jgi:hypothetical protein